MPFPIMEAKSDSERLRLINASAATVRVSGALSPDNIHNHPQNLNFSVPESGLNGLKFLRWYSASAVHESAVHGQR